jgi:uncharacterized protein YecT (DUF1311 family)
MNKFRSVLFIIVVFLSVNLYSQTQAEMTYAAMQDYKLADTALNEVYNKILKEYKSDKVFIRNLKESQNLWIMFRDAEIKLKFSEYSSRAGSARSMCQLFLLKDLTEERTADLKKWLEGAEEGDACAGSLKKQ